MMCEQEVVADIHWKMVMGNAKFICANWSIWPMKKIDQSDLRFWKNKGSKRSKGGQLDRKSRRKLIQKASIWSNDIFGQTSRPTLYQIISGTKCDNIDTKPIFFYRKSCTYGTQRDRKMKKTGSIPRKFPTT